MKENGLEVHECPDCGADCYCSRGPDDCLHDCEAGIEDDFDDQDSEE